jgi:PPOX class probable F420-dependent enzyme
VELNVLSLGGDQILNAIDHADDFPSLRGARYLSLKTFRKSGVGVPTPVWFAHQGDALVVYSKANAGKIKRLRMSESCEVAVCDVRGRLAGEWLAAEGVIVTNDAERREIMSALAAKYGWQLRLLNFFAWLAGRIKQRAVIRITAPGVGPG